MLLCELMAHSHRQDRTGQDRAGQGRAGQGRAGQGRAGQAKLVVGLGLF